MYCMINRLKTFQSLPKMRFIKLRLKCSFTRMPNFLKADCFQFMIRCPEMKELENKLTGFHFHPTLSREEWEGKSGYVHDVYETLIKEHKPTQFYLCGWKLMIDDAKNKIIALGYDKKDIHIELYG